MFCLTIITQNVVVSSSLNYSKPQSSSLENLQLIQNMRHKDGIWHKGRDQLERKKKEKISVFKPFKLILHLIKMHGRRGINTTVEKMRWRKSILRRGKKSSYCKSWLVGTVKATFFSQLNSASINSKNNKEPSINNMNCINSAGLIRKERKRSFQ